MNQYPRQRNQHARPNRPHQLAQPRPGRSDSRPQSRPQARPQVSAQLGPRPQVGSRPRPAGQAYQARPQSGPLRQHPANPRLVQRAKFNLALALALFAGLIMIFQILYFVLPKEAKSEVERRNLATFPKLNRTSFADGSWHRGIETYLSDHVPFRKVLIGLDRSAKRVLELKFRPAEDSDNLEIIHGQRQQFDQGNQMTRPSQAEATTSNQPASTKPEPSQTQAEVKEPGQPNRDNTDGEIAYSSYAIIIKGQQGMEIFNYAPALWTDYTNRLNYLSSSLPQNTRLFSMVVPTSIAFYGPEDYRKDNFSTWDAINQAYSELKPEIYKCDAYGFLSKHTNEYIYFRSDHHWTGLGAYYGYASFCQAAGLTPTPLDQMIKTKSQPFLGTIYGYSDQNPVLAQNPDVCEYYRPLHVGIATYSQNSDLSESWQGNLLDPAPFPDYPYLGYSGGDVAVLQIKTDHQPAKNQRIVVLKDSYGNALVPYLMDHYDEVYVIDPRVFTGSLNDFILEHKIGDVLVINYTFASSNPSWLEGFDQMTGYQP